LLDRIRLREISADQLGALAEWLDTEPEVPSQGWFKRFPRMTVCGEGELIKTFLTAEQGPAGKEVFWGKRKDRANRRLHSGYDR
jgi:hypothetical protein